MRTPQAFLWHKGEQRGQAVVIAAGMMMVLTMFVGLAIDAGQLFVARRTMQEAADAAAYAGAVVIYQHKTQAQPPALADARTLAVAAARNDATLNGFTNGVDGFTVTVNNPPTSGDFNGNVLYVQVVIQGNVQTALVPAQSMLTAVTVRATAGSEPLNNQYALIALDRSAASGAINVSNNGSVTLDGGGILVNSTHSTAAINLGGTIDYVCSPDCYTDVAGGVSGSFPNAQTGHNQEPDPFAGYPKPSMPACATGGQTTCLFNSIPSGNPKVMDPGVYTVEISFSGNSQMVFNPGTYILKAGMSFSGQASAVTADGTTTPSCSSSCGAFFFNTNSNYPSAGGTCGDISLSGNGVTRFDAPATGTYAGMSFYQDPVCTQTMTIGGNGAFTGTGTIYLPNALFMLDGNNASLTGSQIVANQINVQNGTISIDFNASTTAQPILPRLTE